MPGGFRRPADRHTTSTQKTKRAAKGKRKPSNAIAEACGNAVAAVGATAVIAATVAASALFSAVSYPFTRGTQKRRERNAGRARQYKEESISREEFIAAMKRFGVDLSDKPSDLHRNIFGSTVSAASKAPRVLRVAKKDVTALKKRMKGMPQEQRLQAALELYNRRWNWEKAFGVKRKQATPGKHDA